MRNRIAKMLISLVLKVTGTFLTHDGGYPVDEGDWGVDSDAAYTARRVLEEAAAEARRQKEIVETPPKTCPFCGNTLDHRGEKVSCLSKSCTYLREKP